MTDWDTAWSDFLGDAARAPAARAPATLGETWNAEWQRTRLDTMLGTSQIVGEAFNDFQAATEAAIGRPAHEALRERGQLLGAATTMDEKARMIAGLVDQAPEDKREELKKLSDFRARAADRAQKIEKDAADVYGATYGLSGVATSWAAGISRQAIEPFNIATMPLGGPLKGPVLKMLGREFAIGAGIQAAQEPFIQVNRDALGLEAGLGQGAMNVLQAGIGQAGLSGLFRAAGAGIRLYRERRVAQGAPGELRVPESPAETPTGEPPAAAAGPRAAEAPAAAEPALTPEAEAALRTVHDVLSDRDLAAAARLAERDQVLEAMAPVDTPAGRQAHMEAIDATAAAIDNHQPAAAPRGPEIIRSEDVAPHEAGVVRADMDQVNSTVISRVQAALNAGAAVTYHVEGKPVEITGIVRGMLTDAQGQRWGLLNLVSPAPGKRTEIEITSPTRELPAASPEPRLSDQPLPAAGEKISSERSAEPDVGGDRQRTAAELRQPEKENLPKAKKGPAARDPATWSLFEYLASRGGLNPDQPAFAQGFLQKILDRNPFVPGFGPLLRKGGLSLEQAVQAAKEGGYVIDAEELAGRPASFTASDFLQLIDEEGRGNRQYQVGREGTKSKAELARERDAELHLIEQEATAQFEELELKPADIDKRLWKRTLEIMDREGQKDALAAYERAILEDEERYAKIAEKRRDVTDDIPGWDVDERGAASPGGAKPADRPGGLDRRGVDEGGRAGDGARPGGGGSGEPPKGARAPTSEATAAGEQELIPGVAPVSTKERLEAQAAKPLRGGEAPAGGMFDENARSQLDLVDQVDQALKRDADRVLEEAGDRDFVMVDKDGKEVSARQAIAEAEEEAAAAAELRDCIGKEPEE